jgi:lysine 6-dehydrogenase
MQNVKRENAHNDEGDHVSRICVLGCGLMGPAVVKDCAESEDVTRVVCCDIDEEQLKKCSEFVSNEKVEPLKLDLTDYRAIVEEMERVDVVVNASAARFSLDVLKGGMETGASIVDLSSGSYPLEGELFDEVEKAGITVVPGCGVDPGLIDILAGHGIDLLDEVEDVYFACGGLPRNPEPPLNYKIVFGGKRMPIRPGKVPVITGGKIVKVNRYDDVEPVHIEGFKEMEAFYDGVPSSLLTLCMEKGVKTFKGKTIRYRGFTQMLKTLLDMGVLSEEPVVFGSQRIVPLDFFHQLIYPLVKFDHEAGDRDITVLQVRVQGKKDDSHMCITYEMMDFYDEEKGITSMARTTGYTAAIVAQMIARGEISQKGIQWPVRVIRGHLFQQLMRTLKERGIDVRETVLKTKTL